MASQHIEETASFTCFPQLTIELRLKIWKAAASTGRDVWILAHYMVKDEDLGYLNFPTEHGGPEPIFKYSSTTPPPSILHVNREARFEALKKYTLAFGISIKFEDMELRSTPTIYVNFEVDRICMDCRVSTGGTEGPYPQLLRMPIRRLAIPWNINHHQLFDCMSKKDPVFWTGIREFTLYDPSLAGRNLPEEGMLKDMSWAYWVVAGIFLSEWAGELQWQYFSDFGISGPDVWEMTTRSMRGDGKIINKSPQLRTLAEMGIEVPSVKVSEAKEGNTEHHVKTSRLESKIIADDWFTPVGYKELVERDKE